jgi:hypothetical protein
MSLTEIDLLEVAWAQCCPMRLRPLRREAPVCGHPEPKGPGFGPSSSTPRWWP